MTVLVAVGLHVQVVEARREVEAVATVGRRVVLVVEVSVGVDVGALDGRSAVCVDDGAGDGDRVRKRLQLEVRQCRGAGGHLELEVAVQVAVGLGVQVVDAGLEVQAVAAVGRGVVLVVVGAVGIDVGALDGGAAVGGNDRAGHRDRGRMGGSRRPERCAADSDDEGQQPDQETANVHRWSFLRMFQVIHGRGFGLLLHGALARRWSPQPRRPGRPTGAPSAPARHEPRSRCWTGMSETGGAAGRQHRRVVRRCDEDETGEHEVPPFELRVVTP